MAEFGEQRLVRSDVSFAHKALFRVMGISDPAHYLHYRYLMMALREIGGTLPTRVLDAGCGNGDYVFFLAKHFPEAQVLGIDIHERQLVQNRAVADQLGLSNARFETDSIPQLNYSENFDLVISIDVLEHIDQQDRAFAALATALQPGGHAFYHIPTIRQKPVPFSRYLGGFHTWAQEEHVADDLSADQVRMAVERSGLEVVSLRRTFGYFSGELATSLFALPFANSLRNRILQAFLAPACRVFAAADVLGIESTRYAVAVLARRPK